jgi:hypothetical protein
MRQSPGSVGKVLVALAWFQALADLYPDDVEARAELLRDTVVEADAFIRTDHHVVPFWKPGDELVRMRPLAIGDRGNLWTWLDWMLSSSSNAAAAVLQRELVLLRHFGRDYPASPEAAAAFLNDTPRAGLAGIFTDAMIGPLARNGLDADRLRQGSLFTRTGKERIPGTRGSVATAGELLRLLVRLEQGRLVDPWSSLEIKRLLYLTDRRIRYASHPALDRSAVFFKSGSLYSCRPEAGFVCEKYHGNVRNYMNSVAIVESEEEGRRLHYLVAVLSNVLRENSAVAHQTLALRIHRFAQSLHPVPMGPPAPDRVAPPVPMPSAEAQTAPGSPGSGQEDAPASGSAGPGEGTGSEAAEPAVTPEGD